MTDYTASTSDVTGTIVVGDHTREGASPHGPYYIHTSATIAGFSDLLQFARPGYKRVVHLTPRLRTHEDYPEAVAFKAFVEEELRGEDPPNPESVYVLTGFENILSSDFGLRRRLNEVHK